MFHKVMVAYGYGQRNSIAKLRPIAFRIKPDDILRRLPLCCISVYTYFAEILTSSNNNVI